MTLFLVVAVAVGALAQGATGVGFALVAAPACALVLDADQVVGTVVLLGLLVDVAIVAQAPRAVDVRLVRNYLLAAAVAVPFAVGALDYVSEEVLVIGSASLALLGAAAVVRGAHAGPRRQTVPLQVVAGFASGFFGLTTGMSGPPVAIETGRRRMPPLAARTSLAAFFALVDLTASTLNRRTAGGLLLGGLAVAVVAGLVAGRRLVGRVSDARLRSGLAAVVAASAVAAMVRVAVGAG